MPRCADQHRPPAHGGQVGLAARRWGIPRADWLDLSTGINPLGWPVPPLPDACWQRLPEDDDGLEAAAADCYGCAAPLPVAGSQAAIGLLPRLRPPGRVALAAPSYGEHAVAWQLAGHRAEWLDPRTIGEASERADVVVVGNPNNPTGTRFAADELLAWHDRLTRRGGWLVVDEAFVDAAPESSVAAAAAGRPGLIVLRSLGKFFGLAGLRVGFVAADTAMLAQLRQQLGPWPLATASRWIARAALADRVWQAQARAALADSARRLVVLLTRHGLPPAGGCALFQWVPTRQAKSIHEALATQAILTRRFDADSGADGLRFGLPGAENEWSRLDAALHRLRATGAMEIQR